MEKWTQLRFCPLFHSLYDGFDAYFPFPLDTSVNRCVALLLQRIICLLYRSRHFSQGYVLFPLLAQEYHLWLSAKLLLYQCQSNDELAYRAFRLYLAREQVDSFLATL